MTVGAGLRPDQLDELAPLLRRAVDLDPRCLARLRRRGERVELLLRLPFGVVVGRALRIDPGVSDSAGADPTDETVAAGPLLAWIVGDGPAPDRRDSDWRWSVAPAAGWRRVEQVPDTVIRDLVRAGALALKDAAAREGIAPGHRAQPRAEVADALLDAVVLRVDDGPRRVEITLRTLSVLTRMGFLPRASEAHVDLAARWVRVVGRFGTVYAERPGADLSLMR